jgi:energy-coupling factor transport system ATP-binding protein
MIAVNHLSFRYPSGSRRILDDICLNIGEGERVLIAGKNGAGKTTFSKILAGLIPRVESGRIEGSFEFCGKPASAYAPETFAQEVTVLFQDFEAQIVSTSVREELVFYPMNTGMAYTGALERAEAICQKFNAQYLLDRRIDELSGGEKQKIALLSLLTASPRMLILDEPFTDVDPASQEMILDFLKYGGYPGGIIVLDQSLDTHAFFDRIILLSNGKVDYDGNQHVIADTARLSAAGLEASGIYRIADCGYQEEPEAIFTYIRDHFAFDENAYQNLIGSDQPSQEALVEIESLYFRYPDAKNNTLDDVNLKIQQGDFIAVLGANGSGKTTVMKLIAGILKPSKGEIRYLGKCYPENPPAGTVGYVYQNPDNQIFAETVFDETAFILRMRGFSEKQIQERVDTVLQSLGLIAYKQADPFSLPKGDRQKLACASILAGEPELIILDEPTTGLDYPSLKGLMETVLDLNQSGKTMVIITHSMETAVSFGNKILAMNQGRIVYYGEKRPFFQNDDLLEANRARRTPIMEMSLKLNGKLLMNEKEFSMCWGKR